jgi:quercetin dioxygenase-like cupin family protein
VGRTKHELGPGDSILFHADLAHSYVNVGDEQALMYLVMTYADHLG